MTGALRLPVTLPTLGEVTVELGPEALALLRAALGTESCAPSASPWMTPEEAAELLRCRKRRIYELVGDGRLTRHGDGRRLLVSRPR